MDDNNLDVFAGLVLLKESSLGAVYQMVKVARQQNHVD